MSLTIEKAFEDDAVQRFERSESGYSFWLKNIPVEIRVILSLNPLRGGFNFKLSHYIHTPTQMGVYHPSRPWGDDEAYALHQAVKTITRYYKEAIDKGHLPSEKWLVAA